MLECDLDSPVPEWIIEYPRTLAVFQELGIDSRCGGKSLAFACQEAGISPARVLSRIYRIVGFLEPDRRLEITPILASIQISLPRTLGEENAPDPMDRRWTTGFFKEPICGTVLLRSTNLDGDGQADLVHHGGPDKAVLAYSAEHYRSWRHTMDNPTLPFGAFGENFTVAGLTEAHVCIGDTWQVGDEAVVQVSQPRQPCWKLARRWRIKTLALQVQQTGRTGWYFRVLHEGVVAAEIPLNLLDRPHPEWTVDRANQVMHGEKFEVAAALELAAISQLSESWQTTLRRKAENVVPDAAARLIGENG